MCRQVSSFWDFPDNSSVYIYLAKFSTGYAKAHVYLALGLSVFGIVANTVNLIVLAQRSMRNAINAILSAVAICDITVMLSVSVFVYRTRVSPPSACVHFTYAWSLFVVSHGDISTMLHTSSLYLTILLGLIRLMSLKGTGVGSSRNMTWKAGWIHSAIVLAIMSILCMPMFVSFKVHPIRMRDNPYCVRYLNLTNSKLLSAITSNSSAQPYYYRSMMTSLAVAKNCLMIKLLFWITGLVYKMLPCTILGILVTMLVRILQEAKKRQLKLQIRNSRPSADRTTAMLLVVVVIFLITESPQGLLAMGVAFFGDNFKVHVYSHMGDLIDLLSLINSSANFIIYCSMSAAYRKAFVQLFIPSQIPTVPKIPVASFMQKRSIEKPSTVAQHDFSLPVGTDEYFL